jgi:hypothetical protein
MSHEECPTCIEAKKLAAVNFQEGSREIPNELSIKAYIHCKICLDERPNGVSPQEFSKIEVGWTDLGLQVFCSRHHANVIHVDFEGHQHPASTSRKAESIVDVLKRVIAGSLMQVKWFRPEDKVPIHSEGMLEGYDEEAGMVRFSETVPFMTFRDRVILDTGGPNKMFSFGGSGKGRGPVLLIPLGDVSLVSVSPIFRIEVRGHFEGIHYDQGGVFLSMLTQYVAAKVLDEG